MAASKHTSNPDTCECPDCLQHAAALARNATIDRRAT